MFFVYVYVEAVINCTHIMIICLLDEVIFFKISVIFGCAGSSFAVQQLSLVVVSRSYSSLWCAGFSLQSTGFSSGDFSCCGAQVLGAWGFNSCSTWAQ